MRLISSNLTNTHTNRINEYSIEELAKMKSLVNLKFTNFIIVIHFEVKSMVESDYIYEMFSSARRKTRVYRTKT